MIEANSVPGYLDNAFTLGSDTDSKGIVRVSVD
jgi:hypothetical protein